MFTTSSISAGAMFWPPRMISSLSRPVMVRKPFSSHLARSPVWYQPLRSALRGLLRLVVIAGHHVGAAHDQLAFLARRDVARRSPDRRCARQDPAPECRRIPCTRAPLGQFIVTMVEVSVMP